MTPQEIDPKSTAGILLREHDSPKQALKYAKRMAKECTNSVMAQEYAEAARQIKAAIERDESASSAITDYYKDRNRGGWAAPRNPTASQDKESS